MPSHNELAREQQALAIGTLAVTATLTLTVWQVRGHRIVEVDTTDGAVAVTLPAAGDQVKGCKLLCANRGANNLTVVVTAGFGGGGLGMDTITLTRGECALVVCTANAWYQNHDSNAA